MTDLLKRPFEPSLELNLAERQSYDGYLKLEVLLSAQAPLSSPEHHDELLFIIQHQTTELWLKLIIHELSAGLTHLAADEVDPCLKVLARVKHIQRQLFEQWAVLETLTPSEYVQFRHVLGPASGFQSLQYRIVEFLLGNKHGGMTRVFAHAPQAAETLERALATPSLYDEFLRYLGRRGHAVPAALLTRDVREAWTPAPELIPVFKRIYEDPDAHWEAYHLCESLIDVEEAFQLWRFRHMKTVERIIGYKRGTGGSSGVQFLKAALDLRFFPELLEVRTVIEGPA
jgi:tryptophan 2,3-dioxygenase